MTDNASPDETIPMDPDKEARMLLNPPPDGVQFQQANQSSNGQVVLPVTNGRTTSGVGMTKQELMRYANDPFWVRLRLFLFVLFWVVWFAMLIGAIAIVALAPGCPLTSSLPWWKKVSMVEIKTGITEGDGMPRDHAIKRVTDIVTDIKSNLKSFQEMKVNTIVLSGIDGYLLVPPTLESNDSRDALNAMKNAVSSLAQEEDIKLILGIDLASTARDIAWFNQPNNSEYKDFYISASDTQSTPLPDTFWHYDSEQAAYILKLDQRPKPRDAPNPNYNNITRPVLNFATPAVKEQVHSAIIAWMKTKVDGILVEGALYEYTPTLKLRKSKEAEIELHKAVKKAGQTKTFMMSDADLTSDAFQEGEEEASFDLAPENSLWDKLSSSNDLKETLTKVFAQFVKTEEEKKNETESKPDRAEVGRNWRSYLLPYPSSASNTIANRSGAIVEGITTAVYLIPKSTPVLTYGSATLRMSPPVKDQLEAVKKDEPLIKRLTELRSEQAETLLIGDTTLPRVSGSDKVFAVYRAAPGKNGYLLLINFATTSQTVSLERADFGKLDTIVSQRVILVDSRSPSKDVGLDVQLDQIKLGPSQTMLVEFSSAE